MGTCVGTLSLRTLHPPKVHAGGWEVEGGLGLRCMRNSFVKTGQKDWRDAGKKLLYHRQKFLFYGAPDDVRAGQVRARGTPGVPFG